MEPLPLSASSSRSSGGGGFVGGGPHSAVGLVASGGSDHKLSAKLESWSATLAGGGRGVMRAAAGGLTLRRGDSAVGTGPAKLLSVAVLGVSGSEKDKGSVGIGKSCLCNRFIQPLADNYSVDHISVFSQSDFSGRVVNNDHFLYWGDIRKINEEGTEFHVQVVEQTEFFDDASFQPFRASGKSEPYFKRCANTRLSSAEKLAYICKDQLGLEREYEQKVMPEGRFVVDGFLVLFDVSLVPNRSPERQVEITSQILMSVLRSKKPAVIVATKCDEANEVLVRELERLVNRKEFKTLNIPVVETSSHENINVDHAFFALAQLVDKTRGRSRIISYMEAAHVRREVLDYTTEGYVRLLRQEVRDYGSLWVTALKKLAQFGEYQNYANEFGGESAQRLFRRHVKKLKDEYLGEKVQRYFDLLPEVLREMFPDFDTLGEGDWALVKERVRAHPDFHHFFIEHPNDTTWMEADLFEGDAAENRIPFEILEMPDAETVFKNHLNQLHAHHKILELRQDFKKMLEDMGCVTPGKSLNELRVLFLGRECFENLPENEIEEIYELHQRELIQKAKRNFQELLLERADLFYQFRSSPAGTVTQDDILDITESLQEDSRWKALDRLDADRKLLLFQHLGFVHCPIREHCPAFPHCTDSLVERIVAKKAQRPPSWSRTSDNNHLNLVVLGVESLASTLAQAVRTLCQDDEFDHQGQVFSLDYRTISGDVALPENAFRTQDFLPHVIVFGPRANLTFKELETLREEGQALADSLQCPFIDVCIEGSLNPEDPNILFKEALVEDALRALIESIRHRSGLLNIYKSVPNNAEPDIRQVAVPTESVLIFSVFNLSLPFPRIIMCLLCGDPYSVENVLGPLLKQQNCYLSGERSLALETQLGDHKRKVEVILSSYHSATDFRDELIHGFILVYSTRRKASLATLSAFSMNIPELPIQLLAVTESIPGASAGFSVSSELDTLLINEGNNLADRLNAHFMTSTSAIQQKSSFYTPFFKEVFEKKSEIERAFSMDDSARLDDSGEGTLERPRRQPMPPPRIDSYRMYSRQPGPPSNASRSGSGSEIYERLHDDGPAPGRFDDRLRLSPSEDSDAYNSMDRQNGGNVAVPGGGSEHLVKPSQVKTRKKQQGWVDDSIFIRRSGHEDDFAANGSSVNAGAFTTGRRGRGPPPIKPRAQLPGKLNMNDFQKVTTAISSMQVDITKRSPRSSTGSAPLASAEDVDQQGYAVPRDTLTGTPQTGEVYAQPLTDPANGRVNHRLSHRERREQLSLQKDKDSDSETDSSSDEARSSGASRSRSSGQKRPRKKRNTAIPVATPKVPTLPAARPALPQSVGRVSPPEEERAKLDDSASAFAQDDASPKTDKEMEKQRKKFDKELKQRQKDAERRKLKDEKRRVKEAEKQEKQEAKDRKKEAKTKMKANSVQAHTSLDDYRTSAENPLPEFLEMAILFIEKEGLDAEGLYRVPGNRAHVDLLFQKFDEDHNVDIIALDIAVNAVATAVKDFFFKRLPPILDPEHMSELESISLMQDRSIKILELGKLLKRLPKTNFAVLKFIFQHFVRVTELSKDNCMDSKNLAICWWPTLLQYEFGDLGKFESMRPHLEDIVQTMIDQFRFLFCDQEEVMMV
eukprot:maker-scaffold355_size198070-snap-gene-0.30 protein:Tk03293 transcript:maker-scaffold355_size198070-snap-gene-0.30-mRNA-1 annotation:"rho gtpase-activating protein 190 isoform x5"